MSSHTMAEGFMYQGNMVRFVKFNLTDRWGFNRYSDDITLPDMLRDESISDKEKIAALSRELFDNEECVEHVHRMLNEFDEAVTGLSSGRTGYDNRLASQAAVARRRAVSACEALDRKEKSSSAVANLAAGSGVGLIGSRMRQFSRASSDECDNLRVWAREAHNEAVLVFYKCKVEYLRKVVDDMVNGICP